MNSVVLILGVQQSDSVIHIYIYMHPFKNSFPIWVITECWADFLVLYSRSLLVIYFNYSSMYMQLDFMASETNGVGLGWRMLANISDIQILSWWKFLRVRSSFFFFFSTGQRVPYSTWVMGFHVPSVYHPQLYENPAQRLRTLWPLEQRSSLSIEKLAVWILRVITKKWRITSLDHICLHLTRIKQMKLFSPEAFLTLTSLLKPF